MIRWLLGYWRSRAKRDGPVSDPRCEVFNDYPCPVCGGQLYQGNMAWGRTPPVCFDDEIWTNGPDYWQRLRLEAGR